MSHLSSMLALFMLAGCAQISTAPYGKPFGTDRNGYDTSGWLETVDTDNGQVFVYNSDFDQAYVGGQVLGIRGQNGRGEFLRFDDALQEAIAAGNRGDFRITKGEEFFARLGLRNEYWRVRKAQGDPIAGTSLGFARADAGIVTQSMLFNLNYVKRASGIVISNEAIGISLMREHSVQTDADSEGVEGLLSFQQITSYHHKVLAGYGIASSAFGGTLFLGYPSEASWTSPYWCGGCDIPANR